MFYVVEEKNIQVDGENNVWSKSIAVMAVNSEKWRINRYFKKIWIKYRNEHEDEYDSFKVINDDHVVFFGPGMSIVDLYISDNIKVVFEL